jgi:hypothetical protein
MDEYNFRKDEHGLPLIEDCQQNLYVKYMMSHDTIALYRALFWNEGGLRDKFEAF